MVEFTTNERNEQFLICDGIKGQVFKVKPELFDRFLKANERRAVITLPGYSIAILMEPDNNLIELQSVAYKMKDWYMLNKVEAFPKQFKRYLL